MDDFGNDIDQNLSLGAIYKRVYFFTGAAHGVRWFGHVISADNAY